MSELVPTTGMYALLSLITCLKIAIFLAVLTLTFLVDAVAKKAKSIHGLNLMAFLFIVIAALEFFNVMANAYGTFPLLESHTTLRYITTPLFILAGLSLIWYLWGVNKNIHEHK